MSAQATDLDAVKSRVEEQLKEILQIDQWAHERSIDVAEGAARSPELRAWAGTTKARLQAVVEGLVNDAPFIHVDMKPVISEAVMDLVFIEHEDCPYLSLRTAALLRALKRL